MTMTAGDAYSIAPGREGWVVGDKNMLHMNLTILAKIMLFDKLAENNLIVLIDSSATLEGPFISA
jgi:hypothetical protein